MAFISKLHLLLLHFPIALVLAAAGAELVVIATDWRTWRTIAVANLHMGAALAIVTAMTGWLFARSPLVDVGPPLEWHRWLGVACAVAATVAALLSSPLYGSSARGVRVPLHVVRHRASRGRHRSSGRGARVGGRIPSTVVNEAAF